MNYLAHIYLAGEGADARLGALLGDFVKPSADENFSSIVRREIQIHRSIDAFTDSHQVVLSSKMLFASDSRRFAGIILDIFYDHLLAVQWEQYCSVALEDFAACFYQDLSTTEIQLPDRLAQIAPTMIEEDWLSSYRNICGMERSVERVAQRLSNGAHAVRLGLEVVHLHYAELKAGFANFFPELMDFAVYERGQLIANLGYTR